MIERTPEDVQRFHDDMARIEKTLRMTSREATQRLKGRKIVEVRLQPFANGRGGKATDPVIVLDDGTKLKFNTQETDVDRYGVELLICGS